MIRAFVAVLLDAATCMRLGAEVQRLRQVSRGVTWVSVASLHITLKFLGSLDEARLPGVTIALTGLTTMSGFDLTIRGLGAFPSHDRPRVIWAGAEAGSADLVRLAEGVETALSPLGIGGEKRAFTPHITLGRVREPRRNDALAAALQDARSTMFGVVGVGGISLMQSVLAPSGARYTELAHVPLSAPHA